MEMERGIDPDSLLDYVELQIFPIQNRYEAYVCSSNRAHKVASGTLKQLLLHSPRVKDLSSKGSNTNFKILPPDNSNDAEWFTTATLKRFLHIIGSPDILSIGNEITQLEETRKFQLSLSVKAEVDITSSINSKNELLRAVDLRLTALKDELALAFDRATGARCSTKDISDLENFAHHFGAKDIRDSLQKFVEISIFPSPQDLINIRFNKNDRNAPAPPIAFPAKAAQIERQNSTDDENSSVSSEDKQASVERSRAPTRSSATPRRSASPMRRIQIGRSGSHRAAALTIKSLNYFPPREKLGFQRDAGSNSSEEEEEDPEKPKKNNVLRMSVQDKISLFESKQRDESVNIPKTKTLLNTKKGVLRRWSSGMGENATQNQQHHLPDNINNNTENTLVSTKNVAPEAEVSAETAENIIQVETLEPEREGSCEKHVDSIEWSQLKEAELNQLFTEMMENKPVKPRKLTNDVSKSKKSEQRGGFYDHYKQKRDEKLQRETAGKRAEKEAQLNVMQQRFLDENNKLQKTQKNPIPVTNTRKESPKPLVLKKATPKPPSPLPTTRKSWPSPQPPKPKEASPSRTTSRKPQSTSSSDVRSSTKSEKSKPRSTTPKSTPDVVTNRNLKKTINEKKQKQPTVMKTTKSTKPIKVNNTPESESKPSFYNKVTKKNSVVPLETKPFLRKGSGMKTKVADQPEEASRRSSETLVIQSEENEVGMITDVTETVELEPQVVKLKSEEELESESESVIPKRVEMTEQELVISPTAWVEVEAEVEEEIISSPVQSVSPVKGVVKGGDGIGIGITSPRIRHSLSQMMLEDNSEEGGDNGEWGNAEHPPALVYHKDSPKGFKRLLNPTKGRRSFFSLSTFRGSKGY